MGDWATIGLAVALAFFFGYSLTIGPVLRAKVPFRAAVKVALAADTISIAVMETVDNAVMLAVPGAMDAGVGSLLFWGSLAFALAVAFVVTVPINRWLIGRGRGHVEQDARRARRARSWCLLGQDEEKYTPRGYLSQRASGLST